MAHRDRYCSATECPLLGAKRPLYNRIPQPQVDFGQEHADDSVNILIDMSY
jgi:hypothetical protein